MKDVHRALDEYDTWIAVPPRDDDEDTASAHASDRPARERRAALLGVPGPGDYRSGRSEAPA